MVIFPGHYFDLTFSLCHGFEMRMFEMKMSTGVRPRLARNKPMQWVSFFCVFLLDLY